MKMKYFHTELLGFLDYSMVRTMKKSKKKKTLILCVIHHRQNPSESTYEIF
jgi:hypothetical protein